MSKILKIIYCSICFIILTEKATASSSCNEIVPGPFYDASTDISSLQPGDPSKIKLKSDIAYKKIPNINDPDLLKLTTLDVHYIPPKENTAAKPFVIFLHGGDFKGNKDIIKRYPKFIEYFIKKGFVFASLNYRVYTGPRPTRNKVITLQDEGDDIASAVRWLSENAQEFGGRKNDFIFIGFSSGAHLATLLATDDSYFKRAGLSFDMLKGAVSLDVPYYNLPLNLELIDRDKNLYVRKRFLEGLFGKTADEQLVGSPINYISAKKSPKPLFLVTSGKKEGNPQSVSYLATSVFKAELEKNGHISQFFSLQNFRHTELVEKFNATDDEMLSSALGNFLDRIYNTNKNEPSSTELSSKLVAELDKSLGGAVKAGVTGGVVSFVSPKSSLIVSCGFAVAGSTQKITDATLFSVGSVTKAFTGMILAKAVLEKKVFIDDLVTKYLPSPLKDNKSLSGITLKQLITHTSGLPSMPQNLLKKDINNPAAGYTLAMLNECIANEKTCINRKPAGKFYYSNLGISLLGIALQNTIKDPAHGIPYENYNELLQQYLFFPAGIDEIYGESDLLLFTKNYFETYKSSLSSKALDSVLSRFSSGSTYFADMGSMASAGEAVVSARAMFSLLKYLSGLANSPIISPPFIAELTRPMATGMVQNIPDVGIAYGLFARKLSDGTEYFYKDGSTKTGYQAWFGWSKQHRSGLFVALNAKSNNFQDLQGPLLDKLIKLSK